MGDLTAAAFFWFLGGRSRSLMRSGRVTTEAPRTKVQRTEKMVDLCSFSVSVAENVMGTVTVSTS